MPRLPDLCLVALLVTLAGAAVAEDSHMPRDRSGRPPTVTPDEVDDWLLSSLFGRWRQEDRHSAERYLADPGLAALRARNRFGIPVSCNGRPCRAITPSPLSAEDRAILMKRGVRALPPDVPLFQRPPRITARAGED